MPTSTRHVLILAIGFLLPAMTVAAEPADGLPARLARDARAPWQRQGLITLGAGAALTYLSLRTENTAATADYLEGSWLEAPADTGDLFGGGTVIAGGTAAILALGLSTGSSSLRDLGLDLASGIAVSSAYVWTLKPLVGRTRPNGGPHSFPSGHTTLAFTAASIIDRHAGWQVSTLAYALATGTAAGRVEDRRHHLSDVVFGATLGLAIGGVHPVSSTWDWAARHLSPRPAGGLAVHGTF